MEHVNIRFLERSEYIKTRPLAELTFGNEDGFLDDYYADGGLISHGRIAVCEGCDADGESKIEDAADNGTDEGKYASDLEEYSCKDDADDFENKRILSMVHIVPMLMTSTDGVTVPTSYILCVATDPEHRHHGYMDTIFHMVLPILKEEGDAYAFLCPVNTAIYRHLGFTIDWTFDPIYTDLLLADDGLTICSACLLNADAFSEPTRIEVKVDG